MTGGLEHWRKNLDMQVFQQEKISLCKITGGLEDKKSAGKNSPFKMAGGLEDSGIFQEKK